MAEVCNICEEALGERPRTELLCHHFYHSDCLFTNIVVANEFHDVQCVVCHQRLLPDFEEEHEEEEEEEEEQTDNETVASRTRIRTLWLTDEGFQKKMKSYHKANRELSRPLGAFSRFLAIKKAEVHSRFALLKAQYEGISNVKKNEIKESQEYKQYRSSLAKVNTLYSKLHQEYNIQSYQFHYLHIYPGLKTLERRRHRWSQHPGRMIRRALRLRLY
jgi:hypothetical protein